MLKVHVLSICPRCNGKAYIPMGETKDSQGHPYTLHIPCPFCEGSGNQPHWIDLKDFAKLLQQAQCPHNHTSYYGSTRFYAGGVEDDIRENCDDCGANLDQPTLSDNPKDEK